MYKTKYVKTNINTREDILNIGTSCHMYDNKGFDKIF